MGRIEATDQEQQKGCRYQPYKQAGHIYDPHTMAVLIPASEESQSGQDTKVFALRVVLLQLTPYPPPSLLSADHRFLWSGGGPSLQWRQQQQQEPHAWAWQQQQLSQGPPRGQAEVRILYHILLVQSSLLLQPTLRCGRKDSCLMER
jgi:hypothetical protein